MAKELKLSPPWVTFVSELKALFEQDDDVEIIYKDGSDTVKLYVDDDEKAAALTELIPMQRIYGNVAINVQVIPSNRNNEAIETLFEKAFKGNPVLTSVINTESPFGNMHYAMFQKKVVQFYNDDLCDPNGNMSTLYEDIARDVFGEDTGMFFCTDTK